MKKRYKKGQFYLLTVIILISLFVVFSSTYNFLRKDQGVGVYDLKKELGIEIEKTMDHISYNKLNDSSAENILSELADIYVEKAGDNKNSFFIYGTSSNLKLKGFKATDDNISVIIDGIYQNLNVNVGEEFGPNSYNVANDFGISVGDIKKEFKIHQGQSFYYLIHYKESGGEYIVAHN